jgi:hypothetical protein
LITGGQAASVEGVPDHREDVGIILAGGTAEVGVELARAELGRRQAERDVEGARGAGGADPGAADLDVMRSSA